MAQFDQQNEYCKSKCPQSIAETMKSTLSTLSIRSKNETPEERKQRKKALKEYRKVKLFYYVYAYKYIYIKSLLVKLLL